MKKIIILSLTFAMLSIFNTCLASTYKMSCPFPNGRYSQHTVINNSGYAWRLGWTPSDITTAFFTIYPTSWPNQKVGYDRACLMLTCNAPSVSTSSNQKISVSATIDLCEEGICIPEGNGVFECGT